MSSPRKTKVEEELTQIDLLGAAAASLGAIFCCHIALFIGPRMKKLLEDFGGELPALTRLALMPGFPLLLGLISAILVALALVVKTSVGVRRGLIVGASFLSLSTSGLCLYGIYSPSFAVLIEYIEYRAGPPETRGW